LKISKMGFDPDRVVDRISGIVRFVSEIPLEAGEPEIFNYSAKMCDSRKFFPVGCYDRNGGAGLTREDARMAALGEAIERYCSSIYFPDELLIGSYSELGRRTRALAPGEIAIFHPQQRGHIGYSWFTEDTLLCWIGGSSITRNEPVLIPACLTFVPYHPFWAERGEQTIGPSITTGQAAASSYRDAVLRGIYEIVERDAFMITWLNRLTVPRIDIDSSPRVAEIFHTRLARPNLRYTLHSLATDLGIPSMLCVLIDTQYDPAMVCTGGASHLNPERAAVKALVEAVQTREWARYMGHRRKPFVVESDYSNLDDFDKHVLLYAYGDMSSAVEFLTDAPAIRPFSDLPDCSTGTVAGDLRRVKMLVESSGHEILVVDLTSEDVGQTGFRVVKVFIPEAQQIEGDHTHRLLGGCRLFEVPRKLGYPVLSSISDFNPHPHPYP
jgi:ribosomal protein S12 methylthiotransferase accessory factor